MDGPGALPPLITLSLLSGEFAVSWRGIRKPRDSANVRILPALEHVSRCHHALDEELSVTPYCIT